MGKSCLLLRFAVSSASVCLISPEPAGPAADNPMTRLHSGTSQSNAEEILLTGLNFYILSVSVQDDTYTESYISTIGVDFVRATFCFI